jgi:hypothetical protein
MVTHSFVGRLSITKRKEGKMRDLAHSLEASADASISPAGHFTITGVVSPVSQWGTSSSSTAQTGSPCALFPDDILSWIITPFRVDAIEQFGL